MQLFGRRGRSDAGRPEVEVLEGISSVMKVVRGYETELDLNHKQITDCKKHAGAARYAYNWLRHEVACVSVETG